MQGHGHPGREETYARARSRPSTRRSQLGGENAERVEIPLEGRHDAGAADAPARRARQAAVRASTATASIAARSCCTGRGCRARWRGAASRRCASTSPAPARRCGCRVCRPTPHSERWASTPLDWLERATDVDPTRIGMTGISLGGHFAPRAVAFEPRFASGAVWGANHNWAEVQHKRLRREGENPVPHYWAHVQWVFGASDRDDFLAKAGGHAPRRHPRPHPRAVPRHARREGPPDRARLCAPDLRPAGQLAAPRAEDLHARAKAAWSTSAPTT